MDGEMNPFNDTMNQRGNTGITAQFVTAATISRDVSTRENLKAEDSQRPRVFACENRRSQQQQREEKHQQCSEAATRFDIPAGCALLVAILLRTVLRYR